MEKKYPGLEPMNEAQAIKSLVESGNGTGVVGGGGGGVGREGGRDRKEAWLDGEKKR
jgi:hypothetical protein